MVWIIVFLNGLATIGRQKIGTYDSLSNGIMYHIDKRNLTQSGPVTPYSVGYIGQHWFAKWRVAGNGTKLLPEPVPSYFNMGSFEQPGVIF